MRETGRTAANRHAAAHRRRIARMKSRRFHLLIPVALAILVAACSSVSAAPSATVPGAGSSTRAPATASPTGTPTSTPIPTPTPQPADDWPVYHLDPGRTGLAPNFPAISGPLSEAWARSLDGAVYAEPLVVHGQVIAATEGDSIYALDPHTGAVIWSKNLGKPVPLNTLPCGDIDPLGITSTPAYDPATNTLFAVAEVTGPHHILFALDPSSGAVLWSRNVDLPGDDPRTHQQRSALAVGNGYVYIGFGGLAGDCGQYTGKVVGVPTSGQGDTIFYRIPVAREGAVWATGGPVLDANGNLYVSTGNGSSSSTYDGSDSVVELSPVLKQLSFFAPSEWAADNNSDLDLGSLSPVLVPGGYVFIAGKRGTGYVLKQGNLGGIGKEVSSASLCAAFGGAAQDGTTIYVPCRSQLRQIQVGADGSITVGWTHQGAGGPPVIGGGAVWTLTGSTLYAIDAGTGKTLASISVGTLPHFASPTLWKGLVFAGTMNGVVAIGA
jgi:outer membrane protein assembly factor BamB